MITEDVCNLLLGVAIISFFWGLYSVHRANRCLKDLVKLVDEDKDA